MPVTVAEADEAAAMRSNILEQFAPDSRDAPAPAITTEAAARLQVQPLLPDRAPFDMQAVQQTDPAIPVTRTDTPSTAFTLQFGAFSKKTGAERMALSLEEKGLLRVFISPLHQEVGTLWRVRTGNYPSRKTAHIALRRLADAGVSPIVVADTAR